METGSNGSSSGTSAAVLEALVSRGWCFRSPEEIRELIQETNTGASTVETELLDIDLRSFGGKSLPDMSALKRLSHLQGPKVLQVVSSRDICQSRIDASSRDSQRSKRLLRFILTDGKSEVTAIEYAPIPSITEEIVPGSKVRLENRIAVNSGILCLNPKVITVLGGVVQSLYDEWQLDQKYSGVPRTAKGPSSKSLDGGPPQFVRLNLEGLSYQVSQQRKLHGSHSNPPESGPTLRCESSQRVGHSGDQTIEEGKKSDNLASNDVDGDTEVPIKSKRTESKGNNHEVRPKEVIEAMPVQNQAAAQKLLQKLSHPGHETRHYRGNRQRGKDKQEEAPVFTLDEWERRKASGSTPTPTSVFNPDVSRDEELARQLQQQLDLEDQHVLARHDTEAERIRMSMFNFGRDGESNESGRESRGRGRGRGRRRGRGRFG